MGAPPPLPVLATTTSIEPNERDRERGEGGRQMEIDIELRDLSLRPIRAPPLVPLAGLESKTHRRTAAAAVSRQHHLCRTKSERERAGFRVGPGSAALTHTSHPHHLCQTR